MMMRLKTMIMVRLADDDEAKSLRPSKPVATTELANSHPSSQPPNDDEQSFFIDY
jgi:hypothetical protein